MLVFCRRLPGVIFRFLAAYILRPGVWILRIRVRRDRFCLASAACRRSGGAHARAASALYSADKPKRIFHQQRAYQKYKVLLWVHYRRHGMRGPSTKASILEVLRQAPKLINPATRFRAAYLAGGNLGALEGILQYRILKRIPKPLRLDHRAYYRGIRGLFPRN